MTEPAELIVRRTVTVEAPRDRAFEVFTAQFGNWWPKQFSIGEADMADFVIEPKVGGRWYELGVDGKECETGRVLAFDPPARIVVAWQLNASWQIDPDPDHASEFEVRFVSEGPNLTRVELEHRGFERHGVEAGGVYGGVNDAQGWTFVLDLYAKAVAGS
jgi:uncharacterized protein YndB with AHSA1/START domain